MNKALTESPEPRTAPFRVKQGSVWLLIVGFWTIVGLTMASLSHSRMVSIGQPSSFIKWVADALLGCYFWALLTPLITRLGDWFRLDASHRYRNVIILLVAGVVITSLHTLIRCFESMLIMGDNLAEYWRVATLELIWRGPWHFLVFAGILGVSYALTYYRRLQERTLAASQLEAQLARAQMDALRSQIQPHFLFNTLNSIMVLIQRSRLDDAQKTVNRLSDLLRYILSRDSDHLVTVAEEMEIVNGYIEIEKLRLEERLKASVNIDPSCLSLRMPPLVIQPLVENAIRHGFGSRPEGGTVSISIRTAHEFLDIIVEDDGVGINMRDARTEQVGIGNTRSRLAHQYGDRFRFQVIPAVPCGTRAEVSIPLRLVGAHDG